MADDFAVGFGFFSVGGLLWLIFGGIYRTPSFQDQLGFVVESPHAIGVPQGVGILLSDLSLALMVVGPLVFWVVLPLAKWSVVRRRRRVKAGEAESE